MLVAMLRAVLLGVLVAAGAGAACPACSNQGDSPTGAPTAPAGTVIDVSGTVTVAQKPLAKGDAVAANDVIETGADGSVAIVLAHNHARWELGPNKRVRAADSLAWSQPASDGTATPVDQDSSAAGRQGERTAASSAATATAPAKTAAAEIAPAAPPSPPSPAPSSAPSPPPSPHTGAASAPRGLVGISSASGGIGGGAKPKTAAPSPAGAASSPTEPPPMQPVAPPPPPPAEISATRAPVPSLNSAGADEAGKLSTCLALGQQVSIVIHVKAGVGDVSFDGAIDPAVKSCITREVRAHAWPNTTGDVKLQITR